MGPESGALLAVRGLTKVYPRRRGGRVEALRGVDLTVGRRRALALVGQSGSGKSTLARCVARLEEATSGEVWFEGVELLSRRGRALRPWRERLQLVLQDSATALDPRHDAAAIVREPLDALGRGTPAERRARAAELMEKVGLPAACAARRPRELSGGERQRLAIARALAVRPALLVLDEAFAGLDVSVQAQVARLLDDLRARDGLTYLHVSHDLALMAEVADDVAVLCEGRVVEAGPAQDVLRHPQHPHTRALVAAAASLPALAPQERAC
ncbi:MAG TPA: ABC transporter ATP-binding protein [Vicinamibacteria bacterium]|jgi:peptide/nickel transport system ATP-binding protein